MTELAEQIAKRFIARRDVKAAQGSDGQYRPVNEKWTMADLADHLEGRATYGHYLLDADSRVKFFAFDCDLATTGLWAQITDLSQAPEDALTGADADHWIEAATLVHEFNPREAWRDRAHPARDFLKYQMRSIAELLSSRIHSLLGIDVVCSYSGSKGVHVYGLTGLIDAAEAREAARLVIASFGDRFRAERGHYVDTDDDPRTGLANFTIEVFPKQDTVKPGHYGNLLRLPLGVNRKNPADPTFLLDQYSAHTVLAPHPDPAALLADGNPWKDPK